MAWLYQLRDDDTTIDLNAGDYSVLRGGFLASPPPRRMALGGENLFRDGADLTGRVFENRRVQVSIEVRGATRDGLIDNLNDITQLLERGAEFSTAGLGSQLILRRQWEDATNVTDFHVLEGVLDLASAETGQLHRHDERIRGNLRLLCKPFALGAAETVSNFAKDPSFEVAGTALADWTEVTAASHTVTANARSTANAKYGQAMLRIAISAATSTPGDTGRRQDIPASPGEVWSFAVWAARTVVGDGSMRARLRIAWLNSGGGTIDDAQVEALLGSFEQISLANQTAPANTANVRISLVLSTIQSTAEANEVVFDGVLAVKAASVPATWVSGRAIANHFDDDGQAHLNYLDVFAPGDVPALMQVKLAENETHDELWAGARHAGRVDDAGLYHEGEDGSATALTQAGDANLTTTAQATTNNARYSGGVARLNQVAGTGAGSATVGQGARFRNEWTISDPPAGQYRVLASVGVEVSSGVSTTAASYAFGLSWTYGAITLLSDTVPDLASFVSPTLIHQNTSTVIMELLDLGTVTLPPVRVPEGQTGANFLLKLFGAVTTNIALGSGTSHVDFWIDYVMLMPIDMGGAYVSKTSAQDVVLLDARTTPGGVWLLNSSDVVQSFPSDQMGRSPEAHPSGTRIYLLCQDADVADIDDGFAATVIVQPRFLVVRGPG